MLYGVSGGVYASAVQHVFVFTPHVFVGAPFTNTALAFAAPRGERGLDEHAQRADQRGSALVGAVYARASVRVSGAEGCVSETESVCACVKRGVDACAGGTIRCEHAAQDGRGTARAPLDAVARLVGQRAAQTLRNKHVEIF